MWIRVRDESSGAEYDVDERAVRPGMTQVEGVPPARNPRRTTYPKAAPVPIVDQVDTSAPEALEPQQQEAPGGPGQSTKESES